MHLLFLISILYFCFFSHFFILGKDYFKISFHALVNSRLTYYFVDLKFMSIHNLKIFSIPLVELCLFDELLNSTISEVVALSVVFPSSECMNLNFYIILLNK